MQALPPDYGINSPYGSVFHWHEDSTAYRLDMIKNWSSRELLIKHYHLTARLDGYNHLSATKTAKDNANVFREALRLRGIDGVRHCIEMDWLYDAGYREVQVFFPELKERRSSDE